MSSPIVKWHKGIRTWRLIRQAKAAIAESREKGRTGPACLVTNLAQMGDVVLSAGVVAALRERLPQTPLLFACQPSWLEVLEGDPIVDGLLGARSLFEVRALARAGLFGTVYVLDIPIPDLLSYLGGVPGIYRYAPPTTADWFAAEEKLLTLYERNAGLPEGIARPHFWIRPEDRQVVQAIWETQQLPTSQDAGPTIALHTQSSMESKNWPLDRWAELIGRWHAERGARFMVVGGPGEASALRGLSGVVHLAGQLSLKETAALIDRCDLFAGLDSGLAYVAEAMQTPGLVVLGATVAETSGPRWNGFSYVRPASACRPACHRACTQQPLCITHLSIEGVDLALQGVWDRVRRNKRKEASCASR
jgi:ADP-heptose:LPS heptosyltransferase